MTETHCLNLPYILPSQSQKHVTHNEALRMLDALVQIAVLDRDLTAPPGAPEDGARFIVAADATDGWAGHDGRIAAWQDGAWAFHAPRIGWLAWIEDEGRLMLFDGSAWVDAPAPAQTPLLGINATADAVNRLAISAPASLFNHAGNGHQHKINKAAAGDTASILFQTGFSGRAEMGTTGDDKWRIKVSGDGATWREAMVVDEATGRVAFPSGGTREVLSAGRTYYVRTDGDDGHDGLTNSSGGAFLTIQKAIDVVATLDIGPFNVTIQMADGTYNAGAAVTGPWLGSGTVTVQGNAGAPANVLISTTGSSAVTVVTGGRLVVKDVKLQTTGGGTFCLHATTSGVISFANVDFGACGSTHVRAADGGTVTCDGSYAISGNAAYHWRAVVNAILRSSSNTITLTGTPAFSVAFAVAERGAVVLANNNTFVGSATGVRYSTTTNGVIDTIGGGAGYLPGSSTGSTSTGGQYV